VASGREWDAIILGSGSGGRSVADGLADAGMDVAMVEPGLVGGECPYWACMPSKALLRPPEAVSAARAVPGVAAGVTSWSSAAAFRDAVVHDRDDAEKAADYRERGVAILRGSGRIGGPGVVEVDGVAHRTARVVVATGSETAWPPVDGLRDVGAWTNREAMEMTAVPGSALVMGGGPVGIEIAQMLSRYGARVTVVEAAQRLLSGEEPEVGDLLAEALRSEGIELLLGREVAGAAGVAGAARIALDDGSQREVERVVVAAGRRPRVEGIGLEAFGIVPGEEGIPVDGRCRAADGVWAVGDVTDVGQFTHLASYQGRIACADMLGHPIEADYSAIPRSVFCDPEVAAVGLTAEEARERGLDTATASVDLAGLERAATYGKGLRGRVGVVADARAGVLVGAHGVGPLASEWIHVAVLAIRARVPVATLQDLIPQFPTFAEAFVTAVRALPARP
jgi:dihydrolipoamide dehydrogenase